MLRGTTHAPPRSGLPARGCRRPTDAGCGTVRVGLLRWPGMWWRRLRYVLLLVALCAIATFPVARRSCIAKTRAAEADELLGYLVDRVAAHVAATGRVPPTAAGPTPETSCCAHGETCPVDTASWAAPGWRELAFSIDSPHRF